jgi:hypothetical protein
MSLGGGVGADGQDPTDLLVDAATAAGITVVVAASNDGPAQLRVASPGSAKTAITVGAAMDPIHERVFGGIIFGYPPYGKEIWYPHDEMSIVDFSSRGPTADGRMKPDVVATGSWVFFGGIPSDWPYTLYLGGGTSYSCPQVAGEAALLTAYIKNEGLNLGPAEIKQAIMQGADPIPGFEDFEQGAGYINCEQSLEILQQMEENDHRGRCRRRWNYHWGSMWFSPVETLRFRDGKAVIRDVTLDPGKYEYFAFWVSEQVDSVRITLNGVELADPADQNWAFGDAGVIYLSTSARGGIDDYYEFENPYFWADSVYQVSSDFIFQNGLMRLVLAGDFSSYEPVHVDEIVIEIVEAKIFTWHNWMFVINKGVDVEQAQVSVYDGEIVKFKDKVKEGEYDLFSFEIPDLNGFAIVELSWKRDWSRWATSDLDVIIFGPTTVNVDGATGASPEVALLTEPGVYTLMVDGYQVYGNRNEKYTLRIIYFANDLVPLWESDIFALTGWIKLFKVPEDGLAVLWIHDTLFGFSYMADYACV